MSYHTIHPWPVAGRVALALVLASGVTACTEEEQRSTDAVLAAFGVAGVEPPSYAVAVAPVAEPEPPAVVEPAAEPVAVVEPPAYVPPPPECRPVFRVVACDEAGNEVWL